MCDETSPAFFSARADRRSTSVSPSPCYQDAAEALARLRVLLSTARKSPGVGTHMEAAIETNAVRQRRAAHAMWSSLEHLVGEDGAAPSQRGPLPPPAFAFTPMATTPSTRLWLSDPCGASENTDEAHYWRRRSSSPVMDPGPNPTNESPTAPRPPWNASTLPPSLSTKEGSGTSGTKARGRRRIATDVTNHLVPHHSPVEQQPSGSTASLGVAPLPSPTPSRPPSDLLADGERERAVRDYLRRLNVLGHDLHEPLDTRDPFADALFNGAALCQLVHTTLRLMGLLTARWAAADPVPCRRPQSLEQVRLNYTAALSALSDADGLSLPARFFRLTPEDFYVSTRPTPLLDVYFHLISQFLPSPEMLAAGGAAGGLSTPECLLAWQPPADDSIFQADLLTADGASRLIKAERRACEMLYVHGVLPDPDHYALPSDDCLVPCAVAAPHVTCGGSAGDSISTELVPRLRAPEALYVPSVFPYLCNGTVLCSLAHHMAGDGAASLAAPPFRAPKTRASCLRNIRAALAAVWEVTGAALPPSLDEDVFAGNRRSVVALLDVMATALMPQLPSTTTFPEKTSGQPQVSPRVRPRSAQGTPSGVDQATHALGPPHSAKQGAAVRTVRTGVAEPSSNSPAPPKLTLAVAGSTDASVISARDRTSLRTWMFAALGPTFHYRSEDEAFTVDAETFTFAEPCLLFSDGVVLAQLIRALECCRCDALECVRPTSKRPAKRFNVRRCLTFLQKEKGLVMPLPLMDEKLLAGELDGVLHLLKAIRGRYKGA